MNPVVTRPLPGRIATLLAVLSVACFWLLPFSPMIAIGAVSSTRGASGWSRRWAVTGAVLCIAYTVVLSFFFVRLSLQVAF